MCVKSFKNNVLGYIRGILLDIRFIYSTKSNTEFDSICKDFVNNLAGRQTIKSMPLEDIYALREYAKIGDRAGLIWVEAEIQRREFLMKRITLIISITALVISVISCSKK